jgi:hypothetical protein
VARPNCHPLPGSRNAVSMKGRSRGGSIGTAPSLPFSTLRVAPLRRLVCSLVGSPCGSLHKCSVNSAPSIRSIRPLSPSRSSGRLRPLSSSSRNYLEIVVVVMLLWFGSMGQNTHTQKVGHSLKADVTLLADINDVLTISQKTASAMLLLTVLP